MSNLYEKAIKIAYENRANAMIAAKKAADDGRIAKAVEAFKGFMASHPNVKKGATAGLWGGAAMIPTYGITRALGGTPGQAWRNAGITGGGVAAAKATYDYRNEIKGGLGKAGEAIKGLFDKVKSKPAAPQGQNKPSSPASTSKATPSTTAAKEETVKQPRPNNTLDRMSKWDANMQKIIADGVNKANEDAAGIDQQIAMLQTNPVQNAQRISVLQAKKDKLNGNGPKEPIREPLSPKEKEIQSLKQQYDMLGMGDDTGQHAQKRSEILAKIDELRGKKTSQITREASYPTGSLNKSKNWGKISEELTGQDLTDALVDAGQSLLSNRNGLAEAQELMSLVNNAGNLTKGQEIRANELLYTLGFLK